MSEVPLYSTSARMVLSHSRHAQIVPRAPKRATGTPTQSLERRSVLVLDARLRLSLARYPCTALVAGQDEPRCILQQREAR